MLLKLNLQQVFIKLTMFLNYYHHYYLMIFDLLL